MITLQDIHDIERLIYRLLQIRKLVVEGELDMVYGTTTLSADANDVVTEAVIPNIVTYADIVVSIDGDTVWI